MVMRVPEAKVVRFKDKIVKLSEEIARLNAIRAEMMKSEDEQISLTDPDARSMATSGKDTRDRRLQRRPSRGRYQEPSHCGPRGDERRHGPPSTVEYCLEQARTRDGRRDARSLWLIAVTTPSEEIRTVRGRRGSAVTLPKPMTSNSMAAGRFDEQDFRLRGQRSDAYVCPAGQRLAYSFTTKDRGLALTSLPDQCLSELRDQT